MKKLWLFVVFITTAFVFSGCEKGKQTIDYNNVDKLYEQPLEIIQQCVAGKWRLLYHTSDDWIDEYSNTNWTSFDWNYGIRNWSNFTQLQHTL